MKKWLSKHKVLAITLAACIMIPAAIIITLGCMLLTTTQFFPRPEITPEDWMRQSRVVMKGMQQVMQAEPGQIQEIVLAPEDAAALLKFAVNNDQISSMFSGKSTREGVLWTVTYDREGMVHAAYIAPIGIGKLGCMLRITAMVSYANNMFRITPVKCTVGSITIPNSIVTERVLPRVMAELENNQYIPMFHAAVESVSRNENGQVVIQFFPDKAKMLAMSLF